MWNGIADLKQKGLELKYCDRPGYLTSDSNEHFLIFNCGAIYSTNEKQRDGGGYGMTIDGKVFIGADLPNEGNTDIRVSKEFFVDLYNFLFGVHYKSSNFDLIYRRLNAREVRIILNWARMVYSNNLKK